MCQAKFSDREVYVRHRETHVSSLPEESMTAGPSGLRDSLDTFDNDQEASEPMDLQSDDEQEGCGAEPYKIDCTGTRKFARSAATETTYKVKFNDQWQGRRLRDLRRQLHRLFEEVLDRARVGLNDNDLLRVVIRHDALNHAVVIPLIAAGEMNVGRILNKLENVLQSEESLAVTDSFQG